MAEQLVTVFWKSALTKPNIKTSATLIAGDGSAVLRTVIEDVVNGQELFFCFTATRALVSVCFKYLLP